MSTSSASRSLLLVAFLALLAASPAVTQAATRAEVRTAVKVGQAAFPNACKPQVWFTRMGKYEFARAAKGVDIDGRRICAVEVNRFQFPKWSWAMTCTVIAHELGHLAGRQHVYWGKDRNLMFFSFNPEDFTPYWRCGASAKVARTTPKG